MLVAAHKCYKLTLKYSQNKYYHFYITYYIQGLWTMKLVPYLFPTQTWLILREVIKSRNR